MATGPLTPEELPALRATYERMRQDWWAPFEQAITWPPMLPVLRAATRAFDPARQSIDPPGCARPRLHVARRAAAGARAEEETGPRIDRKRLAAGEREADLFTEAA